MMPLVRVVHDDLLFVQIIAVVAAVSADIAVTLDEEYSYWAHSSEQAFDTNLTRSKSFVDKTDLLKELFASPYAIDYIACPRGFGKTTNFRMIEKFSQIEFDNNDVRPWKESRAYRLFRPLKIFQRETIVSQHLARHPVIFLDLGLVAGGGGGAAQGPRTITTQKVIASLNRQLNEYLSYFKPKLRKWYSREIKRKAINDFTVWTKKVLQENIREADIESSLHSFAVALHHCFGSKVIILIDDFDYFVNHAFKSIESIGAIYSTLNRMLNTLAADFHHRVYILMAGTSSIAFAHLQFHEYAQARSFLDSPTNTYSYSYASHFGLDRDELEKLFHAYRCPEQEMAYVKKYYSYAGCDQYDEYVKYNVKSITGYFRAKENSSSSPSPNTQFSYAFQRPGRKSKFISKFFKNPNFLENICALIKHSPVRGKTRTYECKAFRTFLKYVKNDFKFVNVSKCEMMFAFSIEQGFFTPIRDQRDAYVIANYEMRNHIMANLRMFYETHALLDLELVSKQLREMMVCEESANANASASASGEQLKFAFSKTLTAQFQKLVNFYRTNFTLSDFIVHSIIHVAARFDGQLNVIEDYPTPVSYEDSVENVRKRCVTLVTADGAALIVQVTRAKSVQAALYKATTYEYENEKITRLKYLGIDVNSSNKIHITIRARNRTI